jgi:hypothetical protein
MTKRRAKNTRPKKSHPDVLVPDGWGEVETISKTCYQRLSICSIVIPVTEAFQKDPKLINDNVDVSRACLALLKDVPSLKTDLDAISQSHSDKKGDVRETDDFLATIEVGQQYSEWLDRFERLIDPNLNVVAQYIDNRNQQGA